MDEITEKIWWHPRLAGGFGRRARNRLRMKLAFAGAIVFFNSRVIPIRRDAELNPPEAGATHSVQRLFSVPAGQKSNVRAARTECVRAPLKLTLKLSGG